MRLFDFFLTESPAVGRFFIWRLNGDESLFRAKEDYRFFAKRMGVDPRRMIPLSIDDDLPHGPNVKTVRAWEFNDGGGALVEIEMPSQANGIRTGKLAGSQSSFIRGQGYSLNQIGAGFRDEGRRRVSYAVGPGLSTPEGVTPSNWPESMDSMDSNADLEMD